MKLCILLTQLAALTLCVTNPALSKVLAYDSFNRENPALPQDILIADFEQSDYGDWVVSGEAFGPGPARGTLPGQMQVSGFEGNGLVNTFYQGDGTTGTLTSPTFKVERNYINFLIGGGGHPGQTCMNLLADGKIGRASCRERV